MSFSRLFRAAVAPGGARKTLTEETTLIQRLWISRTPPTLATEGEERLTQILRAKLNPTYVEVKDISGGCGAMYQVMIDSEMFKGKRTIQQHKMVNEALSEEIEKLHGLTIQIGNPTLSSGQ